jgi:hypothetical protein
MYLKYISLLQVTYSTKYGIPSPSALNKNEGMRFIEGTGSLSILMEE